ncbi:YceG family protein [Cytobacillus sp. S13-E01]|uniref:YceG family protein n=1 Tax=Cytobacillus sp. S13-E01 TaxID=3031326 RepID=UPI0023D7D18C|nr:YceG family protein [Cytobacillus sp. S13-E01]MDF0725774.1 YceG family protein [Cytobacillus sp. S13-E01]MDF0728362.1 YceG family protein [Cytobacillus sp. S13-E01]
MSNYRNLQITQAKLDSDKWKLTLFKTLPERTPYEKSDEYRFCQLSGRILGTNHDETDYYLNLHELYTSEKIHVLSEILDKSISTLRFQGVQKVHMINQKEKGLSVNRFVAFLEGERLIPTHPNNLVHRHIRQTLISVLETFQQNHKDGFNHPEFRRVLVDIIKWSWNHLNGWLENINLEIEMPRVIWYGDASKSQLYFLYYLMKLGCDVLIFHPEGKDEFAEIDPKQNISQIVTYPATGKLEPFPKEKPDRQSTVAYRATKEINNVLFHEGSHLYKPWQFRNHLPTSVTLKTTYDELFLIAKEPAHIRQNFQVTKGTVLIPSIFSKIMGVSANKKEYWDRLQKLSESKNTELIRNFPFTKEVIANHKFHYQHALDKEGKLHPKKMVESNWWQYKHLPEGIQLAIAHVISNICASPKLIPKNNEKVEDVQLYLFTQATDIAPNHLNLMQLFDYSQDVPKLVLFNTEINGSLSRSDAARILLFNELGIDIVIYNPPGHNCIEQFIDSSMFDTHWLEEMSFQQEFKEPSFLKKIFKSIKF